MANYYCSVCGYATEMMAAGLILGALLLWILSVVTDKYSYRKLVEKHNKTPDSEKSGVLREDNPVNENGSLSSKKVD